MTADPVATVVMAAYNARRWIGEALESAGRQTLKPIEIIVVDDGSTDDTARIVSETAAKDSRIRLIRTENAGVGAARNTGIRAARGTFIAPLDSDDRWHPEKLAKQVRAMEQGGERMGLVYCWSRYIDATGEALGWEYAQAFEGEAPRALILKNFIGCASVPIFRTSALRQVGAYLTREEQGGVQGCEDWDLSIRIAEAFDVGVVPEVLVDYRQAESAMSARAGGMARSFRILIDRARHRNSNLPSLLFRCSQGHFYTFLAKKSYRNADYRGSLYSAMRAVGSDPATLLDRSLVRLAVKSAIHSATRGRLRSPELTRKKSRTPSEANSGTSESGHSPHVSLFERVRNRRWGRALRSQS